MIPGAAESTLRARFVTISPFFHFSQWLLRIHQVDDQLSGFHFRVATASTSAQGRDSGTQQQQRSRLRNGRSLLRGRWRNFLLVVVVEADTRQANQGNQQKEWPLWKAASNCRNLATVANRTTDLVLVEHLDVALRLLRRDVGTGNQRTGRTGILSRCQFVRSRDDIFIRGW